MTDNTNIEALMPCPLCDSAANRVLDTDDYNAWIVCGNVECACEVGDNDGKGASRWNRRAALSNAEPVGYAGRIFVDQLTGERSAVLSNEAKTLPDMTRLFLHPSVPEPTVAWYSPATGSFYLSLDSVPHHIKAMGLQSLGVIEELK